MEFLDSGVMEQRSVENESEIVVRKCKAVAEEESWSGCNQAKHRLGKSTKRTGSSQNVELKEKSWRFSRMS